MAFLSVTGIHPVVILLPSKQKQTYLAEVITSAKELKVLVKRAKGGICFFFATSGDADLVQNAQNVLSKCHLLVKRSLKVVGFIVH